MAAEFDVKLTPAPPEILQRVHGLMAAYHPHLSPGDIAFYVIDESQSLGEMFVIADTDLAQGQHGSASFVIWFALDSWRQMTDNQQNAIADHELHHCGVDEAGKPALIDHDVSEFNDIVARYGLWWVGARETLEALRQMPPNVEE